jgi:uncharacterized protein
VGQAKRRKLAGTYPEATRSAIEIGKCSECQLCCFLPPIMELSKPSYTACANQCAAGCSIHSDPSRPDVCKIFKCMHLEEAMSAALLPPHPLRCKAYVHGHMQKGVIITVDPRDPFVWKKEPRLRLIMEATLSLNRRLTVVDRGYQIVVRSIAEINRVLSTDVVAELRNEGSAPMFPGGDAFGT